MVIIYKLSVKVKPLIPLELWKTIKSSNHFTAKNETGLPFPGISASFPSIMCRDKKDAGQRPASYGQNRIQAQTNQITSAPEIAAISVKGTPMRKKSCVETL